MRLLFIALFLFFFAYVSFAPSDSCPSAVPSCLLTSEAASQHCTGGSPQCGYAPNSDFMRFCYSCPSTSTINIAGKTECPNTWIITVTESSTGNPVGGATVTAIGPGPTLSGITNTKGEVRFTGANPGTYSVSVSPPSPYTYKSTTLTYTECSKDISIETELQCNDTVKVIVRSNADNSPIGNVTINFYDYRNYFINRSVTDENGIAFVGPAKDKYSGGPDFYYVEAVPSSFYNSKKEQKYLSYLAECVIDISTATSCDHSVSITVVDNRTHQPLSSATVDVLKSGSYSGRSGSTDQRGRVVFPNLDTGDYKITIYHPYTGSKDISKTLDFNACKGGELTVFYCDGLNIKFIDKSGNPLSGSIVIYNLSDTSFSRQVATAKTDSSGRAKANVGKGKYIVTGYFYPDIFARTISTGSENECGSEGGPNIENYLLCPNTLLIGVYEVDSNKPISATVTLTGNAPTSTANTNEKGQAFFENVSDGSYYVSVTGGDTSTSKTIEVNRLQCKGCANNVGCASDEYCNTTIYSCEKVQGGECGYVNDHQWVNYQCCSDGDCNTGYRCDSHSCVTRKYDLVVPNETNVSNNVPVKAYEDGQPCASCEISIEDPKGNKKTTTTNTNGEASFLADLKGNYKISLVQNQTVLASKFSIASLRLESDDPLKRILTLFQDEKTKNWLIAILVAIILIALYLRFRRKSGEKVKPEDPEAE